jgi:hypothetical protein
MEARLQMAQRIGRVALLDLKRHTCHLHGYCLVHRASAVVTAGVVCAALSSFDHSSDYRSCQ